MKLFSIVKMSPCSKNCELQNSFSSRVLRNADKILLNFSYTRAVALRNVPTKPAPLTSFVIHSKKFKQSGQALLVAVILFLSVATTIVFGVASPVLRSVNSANDFSISRQSFFVSQAVNEDALYRIKNSMTLSSPSVISLNGASAIATITPVYNGQEVLSSGNGSNLFRNIKTHVSNGNGASFHYGVQSGTGGVTLNNSSSIIGNLYSNGAVAGTGGPEHGDCHNCEGEHNGGNLIKGDVVSAGPVGSISGVHATSSAYAHVISNSTIDKDAYYQNISGSTVWGSSHPGSPDQATTTLPIPDSVIADWENSAVAGGTITSPCPYNTPSNVTLGPVKINCDLNISGDTITLKGPVWVSGTIEVSNSATIKIDPSLGNKSVAIIADKPSNRGSGSKIEISNSTQFLGSGSPNSYVLLVSQNNSAENNQDEAAITVSNSATGALLLYAGHGKIVLSNSVSLKEVTGYKIELNNSASVIYQSGLANLLFSSGPSGGYVFDGWREVQ